LTMQKFFTLSVLNFRLVDEITIELFRY
jgi:hypothetical protein